MKVSLKLALTLLWTVALCCGQSETASAPAGSASTSNPASATAADPPNTSLGPGQSGPVPIQAGTQNPGSPSVPAPLPAPDLPPARKQAADVKPAADAKPAAGKAPASKSGTPTGAAPSKEAQPYVIGALDVLSIKVWGQQNLTSMYAVAADGTISVPLIGDVMADGLTRDQLKETIAKKLADCCFNNDPEVDVQVEKINSKRYFVYGGVGRAGEYPLIRPTTVMDALSEVGGFKDFSNTKKIRIQRTLPSGQTTELKFNYKDVSKGKNMEQNILIQNGDRIFVPE